MNVPYQIILGRQWLDSLKGVSSARHQCLKFPHNGKIIKIAGDIPIKEAEANVIYLPHKVSVREKPTRAEKGKNIVSMVELREKWAKSKLTYKMRTSPKSKISLMNVGWEIMRKIGYKEGQGLGLEGKGMKEPVQAYDGEGKVGLGFNQFPNEQPL